MTLRVGKILLGLAVVGLAGWQVAVLHAHLLRRVRPPSVPTAAVKRDEFIVGVTESGNLESRNVTSVALGETGGTVTWVIKDGLRVEAGDLLLRLDAKEVRDEIDDKGLELNALQAEISQLTRESTKDAENAEQDADRAKESLEVLRKSNRIERGKGQAQLDYDTWQQRRAKLDHERQVRLADQALLPRHAAELAEQKLRAAEFGVWKSEHELDLTNTRHDFSTRQQQDDIDNAVFQAEMARARIATAGRSTEERARMKRHDLDRTRMRLARAVVRAPVSGLVMLGRAWSTEEHWHTIKAGDRLWWDHKVASICNLEDMQIPLRIDELRASQIQVGQEAIVRFEPVPGRKFKGKVVGISPVARRIDRWDDPKAPRDLRVFDVVIAMVTFDASVLRPGMNAEVQVVISRVPDTLVASVQALRRQRGREVVYVKTAAGFRRQEVVVGRRGRDEVEILAGLREGQRVAIVPVPRSALRGK